MRNPGKYNKRITFQVFNGTVDLYGDVRNDLNENWTDFRREWASIEPISGRELYAAEQSQSEVRSKICCRYFRGLKAEMRIKWVDNGDTHIFKIVEPPIDWEERHESYLIMVRELVE